MEVVEQFVLGKLGDPELCEDAVVVTADFAAVVDGATDVSGRRYDGMAGGRWAMSACVAAIRALPAGADRPAAMDTLTRALAGGAADGPCASVTIYAARRREVWQIGDVGFAYRGHLGRPRKLIDEVASAFRAAFVAAEVAAGRVDPARTGPSDPARPVVRELISRQWALRNTLGPYGFAAVDGRPIPAELVVVHPVPDGVDELVIASDGYPEIGPTLAASEATLAGLLERDPWCVRENAGTKGALTGQLSFDDRAFLRLRL